MSALKPFVVRLSSTTLICLTCACAQSAPTSPRVKPVPAAPEVHLSQLYPVYRISDILKQKREPNIFRLSWTTKIGAGGDMAPFFESTDILYNRTARTLKYHYRENNIGLRRSYLFTNVTDEVLYHLSRAAEKSEKEKNVVTRPEQFFKDLTKFGCRRG